VWLQIPITLAEKTKGAIRLGGGVEPQIRGKKITPGLEISCSGKFGRDPAGTCR